MSICKEWNHNLHYHSFVLGAVPAICRLAVDVGCGEGRLTACIAQRSVQAIGIDVDAQALQVARERQQQQPNLQVVQDDFMTPPFLPESVDFISAVATLHHLPLAEALTRCKVLLKRGGVLAVVGLYRPSTWSDYLFAGLGLVASRTVRLFRSWVDVHAPVQMPRASLSEIRIIVGAMLPGAVLKRRLLFRYTLIWRKT